MPAATIRLTAVSSAPHRYRGSNGSVAWNPRGLRRRRCAGPMEYQPACTRTISMPRSFHACTTCAARAGSRSRRRSSSRPISMPAAARAGEVSASAARSAPPTTRVAREAAAHRRLRPPPSPSAARLTTPRDGGRPVARAAVAWKKRSGMRSAAVSMRQASGGRRQEPAVLPAGPWARGRRTVKHRGRRTPAPSSVDPRPAGGQPMPRQPEDALARPDGRPELPPQRPDVHRLDRAERPARPARRLDGDPPRRPVGGPHLPVDDEPRAVPRDPDREPGRRITPLRRAAEEAQPGMEAGDVRIVDELVLRDAADARILVGDPVGLVEEDSLAPEGHADRLRGPRLEAVLRVEDGQAPRDAAGARRLVEHVLEPPDAP